VELLAFLVVVVEAVGHLLTSWEVVVVSNLEK
jgi:hypothetical protein